MCGMEKVDLKPLESLGFVFDRILRDLDWEAFDIRLVDCFVELFCRYAVDICEDREFGRTYRDRIVSCFIKCLACEDVPLDDVYAAGKLLDRLNRIVFPEHYS